MNKREFEKIARNIAWRSRVLNEQPSTSPELARMVDDLYAAGYVCARKHIAGFDGVEITGPGREVFAAAPRTRKPGKKQTCTLYDLREVHHAGEAFDAIAAGDFATAQRIYDALESASLRNMIAEGLDHLYGEYTCEEIAAQMERPEHVSDLDAVTAIFGTYGFEITQKRAGCCIWVSGDTKPHRDELKSFGFRWAPKRGAWYWKPAA